EKVKRSEPIARVACLHMSYPSFAEWDEHHRRFAKRSNARVVSNNEFSRERQQWPLTVGADSGRGQGDWRIVRYTTFAEMLCTKSPRSTITGWGGRARSAPRCWSRTATAPSWIRAPARHWTR